MKNLFLLNYFIDITNLFFAIENILVGVLFIYDVSHIKPLGLHGLIFLISFICTIQNIDIHVLLLRINLQHEINKLILH